MIKMQKNMRQQALILLAMALLTVSLLLTGCSTQAGASNSGTGNSGSSSVTTPGSDIQSINQQVQNGVQSIDGAQNDTDNADATSTTENGADQQP